MFNKSIITPLFLMSLVFSSQVSANLVLIQSPSGAVAEDTLGGYDMTDFSVILGASNTSSVAAPITEDLLHFVDENGTSLILDQGTTAGNTWWENGELLDYNTYTTDQHWITMLLPENTYAFSFNVGANKNASGWLEAEAYDGSVINRTTMVHALGADEAPGFAVYSESGSCSAIKSITVEPPFIWGVGNFSISQDSCATVPEPSSLLLLSAGFMGLMGSVVARRRRKIS